MILILHSVVAVTEKFITELWELAIAREVSEKRWIVKPIAARILQSIPNLKIKIILLEDISNSWTKKAVVDLITMEEKP
jgi:hypothetical protein